MTTTVTASTPARFLSLVPRLLGFTPRRSIVLVPFAGRSSLGAMRVDLPRDADTDRIASELVGLVCRLPDADGLAMIAYTDAALGESLPRPADGSLGEDDDPVVLHDGLPHRDLAEALRRRADACGLRSVELLCVGRNGWGSYREPGPPRGLAELALTDDEVPLPPPAHDQSAGARLPRVTAVERERVAQALAGIRRAGRHLLGSRDENGGDGGGTDGRGDDGDSGDDGGRGDDRGRIDPLAIAALDALDDLPLFFASVLDRAPTTLDAYAAAMLTWCLSTPGARDIGLVCWLDGTDAAGRALRAQVAWSGGAAYPAEIGERMWGTGPRPDPDRLRRALALARHVTALAPTSARAGGLATCAWLSWALGRSTHAGIYAMRARHTDRDQGLAAIVASFLSAGHLPDWAFRPEERDRAAT